jgi:hypothetical protein
MENMNSLRSILHSVSQLSISLQFYPVTLSPIQHHNHEQCHILSPSLRPQRSASNRSSSHQSSVGQLSQRQHELERPDDTLSPCIGLVGEEDITFVHDMDEGSFLSASSASPPPPVVKRAISVSLSHNDFGAGGHDSLSVENLD